MPTIFCYFFAFIIYGARAVCSWNEFRHISWHILPGTRNIFRMVHWIFQCNRKQSPVWKFTRCFTLCKHWMPLELFDWALSFFSRLFSFNRNVFFSLYVFLAPAFLLWTRRCQTVCEWRVCFKHLQLIRNSDSQLNWFFRQWQNACHRAKPFQSAKVSLWITTWT